MGKFNQPGLEKLREFLNRQEADLLADGATRSREAVRRVPEAKLETDYRQQFAVDGDRILNSMAYTRYIDKTQVFYLVKNDHITHRMLHVQLVSKVARTIGRFLGLNADLIEAIAIGHDVGHPPFGHDGERILSRLCSAIGIGAFHHNVQSVQFLDRVERKGKGWNLCLQTLDGILCHDGEIHNLRVAPATGKNFSDHAEEIEKKVHGQNAQLMPMTLEGCVVRLSDTVSYVGRDIEDAIRLGLIERSELPAESAARLGNTNGKIVYALVTDIILNSYGKPYISFSEEVSHALKQLKKFNYERIYMNPIIKKEVHAIEHIYALLFERFVQDIQNSNMDSPVFGGFADGMVDAYQTAHQPAEIVRDFIAGMTDQFFLSQVPETLRPAMIQI